MSETQSVRAGEHASRFVADSGDPERDAALSIDVIDEESIGILYFDVVPEWQSLPHSVTVDFGQSLYWIEPIVDECNRLASLAMLTTSFAVARGRLSGRLLHLPPGDDGGQRWRVELDPRTVTAPPKIVTDPHLTADGPIPDEGEWRGGEASVRVTRDGRGIIQSVDLCFANPRGR